MDAVFGNVGTIVSFRVGAEDAEFLEKWFQPDFMMNDIVNLGKYTIYLKLMIDGMSSKGFSAGTLPPFSKLENSNREAIIAYSREKYSTPREVVQKSIAEWSESPSAEVEPQRVERPFQRTERPYSRGEGPRQGGVYVEEGPRRFDNRRESRPPQRDRERPVSLNQAFSGAPVDFKGRKRDEERPKKEVDTAGLKKILEESLKK